MLKLLIVAAFVTAVSAYIDYQKHIGKWKAAKIYTDTPEKYVCTHFDALMTDQMCICGKRVAPVLQITTQEYSAKIEIPVVVVNSLDEAADAIETECCSKKPYVVRIVEEYLLVYWPEITQIVVLSRENADEQAMETALSDIEELNNKTGHRLC